VLLVGGWQNSQLCKDIDLWNVDKMTVQQKWKGMNLKIGDMATKRIVINEDTLTVVILGRKALHFIDLKKFETNWIEELGEDGAEKAACEFRKATLNFED